MGTKKILVIEDDSAIRKMLTDLLVIEGFAAITAEDGKSGLHLAQTCLPDLILCDVRMPEMDGYEVLDKLRSNATTATIPFIFLTAHSTNESFRQGMELGADDYLIKPCRAEDLLAAIASRFKKQAAMLDESQKHLNNLRSSIALSLPHELRTPLNGILGLSEVLMDEYEQIERQEIFELAEAIHTSAERLYRLIQNFLLYAELELAMSDRDRIEAFQSWETHYPNVLISNTAIEIARRANREADLHLQLQNTCLCIADLKLKKVVEELTDNAFKFSVSGTPVYISSVVTKDGMILTITDQGRGMTPEQIALLGAYMQFDRKFYEQQGSGLGFTIAKRLVELHGGKITVESIPNQRTSVQVFLPGSREEGKE
jgi:signal transduction histidine kinase